MESESGNFSKECISAFCTKNEIQTYKLIKKISLQHLAEYPTSWDADNYRLKTEKFLSFNEQNILKMIMAEKKILLLLIKAMDRLSELLSFEIKVLSKIMIYRTWYMNSYTLFLCIEGSQKKLYVASQHFRMEKYNFSNIKTLI